MLEGCPHRLPVACGRTSACGEPVKTMTLTRPTTTSWGGFKRVTEREARQKTLRVPPLDQSDV